MTDAVWRPLSPTRAERWPKRPHSATPKRSERTSPAGFHGRKSPRCVTAADGSPSHSRRLWPLMDPDGYDLSTLIQVVALDGATSVRRVDSYWANVGKRHEFV